MRGILQGIDSKNFVGCRFLQDEYEKMDKQREDEEWNMLGKEEQVQLLERALQLVRVSFKCSVKVTSMHLTIFHTYWSC